MNKLGIEKTETEKLKFYERFRVTLTMLYGNSFKNIDRMYTKPNTKIFPIGSQGEAGLKVGIVYCITPRLKLSIETGGYQARYAISDRAERTLSKFKYINVDFYKETFEKSFTTGTVKYKYPLNNNISFNIGAGGGYHDGPNYLYVYYPYADPEDVDYDTSKPNGYGFGGENLSETHFIAEIQIDPEKSNWGAVDYSTCLGFKTYLGYNNSPPVNQNLSFYNRSKVGLNLYYSMVIHL